LKKRGVTSPVVVGCLGLIYFAGCGIGEPLHELFPDLARWGANLLGAAAALGIIMLIGKSS